jgi:hypothetical protein
MLQLETRAGGGERIVHSTAGCRVERLKPCGLFHDRTNNKYPKKDGAMKKLTLLSSILFLCVYFLLAACAPARLLASGDNDYTATPDGGFVGGGQATMAPDGSFVGGKGYTMAPDGSYVGGKDYTMTPDGKYVSGKSYTMAPDGTYVGGKGYVMTPDGKYVGKND